MEEKGQASVEYLLLIVVILIILASVTIPLVSSSVNSTMDISRASDAKNAIQNIANAVDLVYANGPGAKRTVNVYIPLNLVLQGNNTQNIGMNVPLSGNETKYVNSDLNYNVTFDNANFNQGWSTVTVNWVVGNKAITISH
ncbi:MULTISPECIES: hypothetical protein [Methanobacterium]|jgi:uncharacterized protein (UPF0333 family)|uniref:Putative membrane protein n=3 Tax=Methanobacterium TaxID=2160 RepID=A0A090I4N4_METFO|nr:MULTISPECIES: hypothetical protein [Methanobacterium]KUK72539.1 MAG: Uncharacterized protein XD90_1825 [Methanobacterium sp. 42_16]MBF4475369.1 hypothetical protein [Methanobacterium formicicum]MDG3547476.1 hypothetical protein [Methanobacterium formicicum]MDH2659273.1 hypothetical protein [Methanobacterium formicicum]CEA14403.1 putative membrane protein [Methanobacterium formicicum]